MKKNLFAILGLTLVLVTASCSKNNSTAPPPNTTIEGKWVGIYTNFIGPSHYFALTFNSNGVILVEANTAVDIANGTWSMVADSVRATYTYSGSSDTHTIAGKYNTTSNVMDGTIGLGTSTSGKGVFSVTKQ